jgi:sec-independent protein translocase protein TatA
MDLGIGFLEVLAILVVALLVFGPGKLPEIARTIGRISRGLRRASSDFTNAMTRELELEEKSRHTHLKPQYTTKDPQSAANAVVRETPSTAALRTTPPADIAETSASEHADSNGKP